MRPALMFLAVTSGFGVPAAVLFGQSQTDAALRAQPPMAAEPTVVTANRAVLSELRFSDRQDFEDANRGFIATKVDAANPDRYKFLKRDAPSTVNPSLWRQAQLDAINGLFKVADGVYQIRDFSVSSMTIVEGKTGIIVIDTLATPGAAREALDLYRASRSRRSSTATATVITLEERAGWSRRRTLLLEKRRSLRQPGSCKPSP